MNHYQDQELQNVFKSLMQNRNLQFLQNAYVRGKKKPYRNYAWMRNELAGWGVRIPEGAYGSMQDVQDALASLPEINPLFIEYSLKRLVNACGDKYFNMPKYAQARKLYIVLKKYYASSNNLDLISGIRNCHTEAYESIVADEQGRDRLHLHIDRIHTAMHQLLRDVSTAKGIVFVKRDGLGTLYHNLSSRCVSETAEISLLATDEKVLTILNDVRNHKSLAHPNEIQIVPEHIGVCFLKQIALVAEKINMF